MGSMAMYKGSLLIIEEEEADLCVCRHIWGGYLGFAHIVILVSLRVCFFSANKANRGNKPHGLHVKKFGLSFSSKTELEKSCHEVSKYCLYLTITILSILYSCELLERLLTEL